MTLAEFITVLGGPKAVGAQLGLRRSAVTMWLQRGQVPGEYHLPLWRAALERGLPWQPPGAEGLRPLLCALPPGPASAPAQAAE
jgi:hypothetical protein